MKKVQWLTVIIISIIVSTINIIHVIIGSAKTPAGFTYLATGHYYLDYFEYLQHVATGISGRWLPINHFTTDPSLVDWRFFPYILLGKIAMIFHLSPMAAYWLAVFFLTIFTLIGFYLLIDLMLKKEAFVLKIIAFLISIFSGPVYKIFINNGQLLLNPYDYWYGPSVFVRRFGVVPYHTLGILLLLFIIVIINKIWEKIPVFSGLIVATLIIILMTFSPPALASFIPALLVLSAIRFIGFKKDRFRIFLFNLILLILIVPTAFILRRGTGYSGISFEIKWITHDPWWYFLLNLGPMILFFPFGIKEYLKENNFLKQLLLTFTFVSYCLFISPAAYYFGTHNLRFLSSISYIFYGVLTVLGIKKISSISKKYSKAIMILLSSVLIIYFCFLTFYSVNKRSQGLDPGTPETIWTYLPSSIIEGLELLQNGPSLNVLTGPDGGIGMFVPIFSYKKVYVSHPAGAADFEKKQSTAYLFFSGKMSSREAEKFLNENRIGFVILTSYDNFDHNTINRYTFLKPIFAKNSIVIWKIINSMKNEK